MDWLWFTLISYAVGQIIFLWEIKNAHPEWRLFPSAIVAMAWPYFVARRCLAFWRRETPSQ